MRIKYNSKYNNVNNIETSYINKYLGQEIETLLNPESNSIHDVSFSKLYVHIPKIEDFLIPFRDGIDSDRCIFLTGVTGCGKSSVLQYIFPTNLNEKIVIKDGSLYILFSYDHMLGIVNKKRVEASFTNMLKAACSKLYKEIIKAENLKTSREELYNFIEKEKRIINNIKHVHIIVDDIESLGVKMELIPLNYGLALWSCLKRQTANTKKWCSSIIISCRHYMYRMIQKHSIDSKYIEMSGIDSQTLESYPIDDEINISESVKLISIIQRRVDALRETKSNKRWDDAWTVVEEILAKTDDEFGDFILAICINNIRKALTILKNGSKGLGKKRIKHQEHLVLIV